jgi:peptide/nickel transport system ATP-binding protein
MPPISGPRRKLVSIPGSVPEASRMPAGCAFAPRCSERIPDCERIDPVAVPIVNGHRAACVKAKPAPAIRPVLEGAMT